MEKSRTKKYNNQNEEASGYIDSELDTDGGRITELEGGVRERNPDRSMEKGRYGKYR